MPDSDDKTLEQRISRVVSRDGVRFDAEQWKAEHPREVQLIESWKRRAAPASTGGEPKRWCAIMHSRLTKLAVAAVVVALVILGAAVFSGRNASTRLFAQTLQRMRGASYTFRLDIEADGHVVTLDGMVAEPGKMRLDAADGTMHVSTIFDSARGEALILMHGAKAAFRKRADQPLSGAQFTLIAMPSRSIEALWGFPDGSQTSLGRKSIAGRDAEGFGLLRQNEAYTEEIAVWVDREKRIPLEVTITMVPVVEQAAPLRMTLRDFELDVQLDAKLFSLELPEGYVLADSVSLEEVSAPEAARADPGDRPKVMEVLDLLASDRMDEAADRLATIDFSAEMTFPPDAHLFVMTERQVAQLFSADRQKVIEQCLQQGTLMRRLSSEMVKRAQAARVAGDVDAAEKSLLPTLELGRLLIRDPDGLLIVHSVGVAIQYVALRELGTLYEATGDAAALENVKVQIRSVEEQTEQIKQRARDLGP